MNRNDLRKIDLKLLIVFEMLMIECSVTRASQKLFITQSAVSSALARLRILYSDPLFTMEDRRMVPTPRAVEIATLLAPALNSIADAIKKPKAFDPATSTESFNIGLSDDVEFGLFPKLLQQVRMEAPNTTLNVRQTNYIHMPQQLVSGEISVGVGYAVSFPAAAKQKIIRHTQAMLLRADDGSSPLSLDEYCQRPHALVSFAGDISGFVDQELKTLGRARQVVLAVPQFSSLGAVLQGTDLVALVPDHTGEALKAMGGLRIEASPFQAPSFPLSMVWQSSMDKDPAERWLRSRIQMLLGDSSGEAAPT
jgi:LysR family transcriptional activator of mexEF-oprN operon